MRAVCVHRQDSAGQRTSSIGVVYCVAFSSSTMGRCIYRQNLNKVVYYSRLVTIQLHVCCRQTFNKGFQQSIEDYSLHRFKEKALRGSLQVKCSHSLYSLHDKV
ncbi:hypothetical protein AMECASPLE_015436 [Ameca splendens]|uniref:Uncharacterized protein n=1 Tax=Ameca splendens TaxID=208324 RepID=A0ABV0Y1S9_9TELE